MHFLWTQYHKKLFHCFVLKNTIFLYVQYCEILFQTLSNLSPFFKWYYNHMLSYVHKQFHLAKEANLFQ